MAVQQHSQIAYPILSIALVGVVGVMVLCTSPTLHLVSSAGSHTEAHCAEETSPGADLLANVDTVTFWLLSTR